MTSAGSPARDPLADFDAAGLRFVVLQARFHAEITDSLAAGTTRALQEHGARPDDIVTIRVPGAWELPQAAAKAVASGRFDALVALGCVVRGGTPHFEYVCTQATLGLGEVARTAPIPIAFGVLTTDDLAQARARAGDGPENKGYEAALAVLEMVSVYRRLEAD